MRPWRHAVLPVSLALLLLPAAALAVDCGPDCLGLFFEPAADTWCGQVTAFMPVPIYLVLSDPSMAEVSAIAFYVDLDGPVQLTGVNFGSPVICDTFTPGAYCTAWDPPLATAPTTVLATLTVVVTDFSTPATVGLHNFGDPVDDRVWIGLPGGTSVPLASSAGAGQPMIQLNGECGIVPATDTTWSAVKGLYR